MFDIASSGHEPIVTVAVPVYNSAGTLARCLSSASAQTLRDIEILIADDGSTDASAGIAEAAAQGDSRMRVLRMGRNGGKARAMNVMAEEARGTWFAVLDADDCYHPERLARLVAAAEALGLDMAADNLAYYDGGADLVLRTAFNPNAPSRVLTLDDLAGDGVHADFDLGILKPVIRREFHRRHGLAYYEQTRLAEDFYYLMMFLVAGGRGVLLPDPLYRWTLPFGTVSRTWTTTGAGAWRYDYRQALAANDHFIAEMQARSRPDVVRLLERRSAQYRTMMHYIDAQREAAGGHYAAALRSVATHPATWPLLASRITGRLVRAARERQGGPGAPELGLAQAREFFGSAP